MKQPAISWAKMNKDLNAYPDVKQIPNGYTGFLRSGASNAQYVFCFAVDGVADTWDSSFPIPKTLSWACLNLDGSWTIYNLDRWWGLYKDHPIASKILMAEMLGKND
jgi:hypothetical protein